MSASSELLAHEPEMLARLSPALRREVYEHYSAPPSARSLC